MAYASGANQSRASRLCWLAAQLIAALGVIEDTHGEPRLIRKQ